MIVSLETNLLTRLVHFRIFARVETADRSAHPTKRYFLSILDSDFIFCVNGRADTARRRGSYP
ncbi:hypothetical protein DF051_04525 [Burkholderia contaminans]|uniref:Uncharacterized protein n=1 Tax=Burkholderia contaminans TaxID=488447 RepID=A0A3N8QAE6_9BURK|nr:hypothetical protein DF051_04525 [Burkholderia contaminans]